jgi:hypothetical protein
VPSRDTEIRGHRHVPGALDKIPEPMVMPLLRAGSGRHADDHRPKLTRSILEDTAGHPPTSDEPPRRVVSDDNSRRELRNVRGDSCARNYEMSAAFSVTTTGQPRRDGPVERGTERALVGTNSAAERPAIAARGAFQPGAGHIAYGCPHAGPSFTIPVRQSSCIDAIQGLPDPESQCAFTGRQLQKVTSGLH